MKNYFFTLLMLTVVSCNENKMTPEIIEKIETPAVEHINNSYSPTIQEYDLSMYNDKYFMRITPDLNTKSQKLNSTILLMQERDTIFNKVINLDSLQSNIISHGYFNDKEGYKDISREYLVEQITYKTVRTDDLFFNAHLLHKTENKNIDIRFQLTYFPKNRGKLFVNGFDTNNKMNNLKPE